MQQQNINLTQILASVLNPEQNIDLREKSNNYNFMLSILYISFLFVFN